MKKNLFVCDNCMKEEGCETTEYLYDKGWLYSYGTNIKVCNSIVSTIHLHDKHFCCLNCLLAYIHTEYYKLRKGAEDYFADD